MIQGQSEHTAKKQYGLGKVLNQWLSIVERIKFKALNGAYSDEMRSIALRNALYIDANAGSGWNNKVNCIGSPLLFLKEASRYEFKKDIHFIEEDASQMVSLGATLLNDFPEEEIELWNGNNREILPKIVEQSGKRYGLIYYDPNGPKDLFESVANICDHSNSRFIDVLIRLSGTDYKRVKNGLNAFGIKNNQAHLIGKYPNLKDQLKIIKKKVWLIRDIIDPDPAQWTFLFGTNWTDYPSWETQGFYKTTSSKGTAILNRVSYTIPELDNYDKV